MSDLDPHLQRAFDALASDLGRSPGPGAAAAISTARTRRRTRVGGVALVALLTLGGGLTLPGVVSSGDGVAAGGGSARLDASALERATDGWIDGWQDRPPSSQAGSGGYAAASCSYVASNKGEAAPDPVAIGRSRFVALPDDSLASLTIEQYDSDGTAASSQELSSPAPGTCGTTSTIEVDGVRVRHDSMPREPGATVWLHDIWSVHIGTGRAQLEIASATTGADESTADAVAEALVAGLRDGRTASGDTIVVPPGRELLPAWGQIDLEGAMAGWRSPTRAAVSTVPEVLCLDERLSSGAIVSAGGGSPRGFSHTFAAYDDPAGGEERVAAMLEQLGGCSYPTDLQLETLPNGVHLATFDTGGSEGKGAIWFAANGDRAGLVGMDGADRPMPASARQDVADALFEILHLPRPE